MDDYTKAIQESSWLSGLSDLLFNPEGTRAIQAEYERGKGGTGGGLALAQAAKELVNRNLITPGMMVAESVGSLPDSEILGAVKGAYGAAPNAGLQLLNFVRGLTGEGKPVVMPKQGAKAEYSDIDSATKTSGGDSWYMPSTPSVNPNERKAGMRGKRTAQETGAQQQAAEPAAPVQSLQQASKSPMDNFVEMLKTVERPKQVSLADQYAKAIESLGANKFSDELPEADKSRLTQEMFLKMILGGARPGATFTGATSEAMLGNLQAQNELQKSRLAEFDKKQQQQMAQIEKQLSYANDDRKNALENYDKIFDNIAKIGDLQVSQQANDVAANNARRMGLDLVNGPTGKKVILDKTTGATKPTNIPNDERTGPGAEIAAKIALAKKYENDPTAMRVLGVEGKDRSEQTAAALTKDVLSSYVPTPGKPALDPAQTYLDILAKLQGKQSQSGQDITVGTKVPKGQKDGVFVDGMGRKITIQGGTVTKIEPK